MGENTIGDVYYEYGHGYSIDVRFFQIVKLTDKTIRFQKIRRIQDFIEVTPDQSVKSMIYPLQDDFEDISFVARKSSFTDGIYNPKSHKVLLFPLRKYERPIEQIIYS